MVDRIRGEIHDMRLLDTLTDEVEGGGDLTNSAAAKVYHMDVERGAGVVRQMRINPHMAYRMDLRGITVPDLRLALQSFSSGL